MIYPTIYLVLEFKQQQKIIAAVNLKEELNTSRKQNSIQVNF